MVVAWANHTRRRGPAPTASPPPRHCQPPPSDHCVAVHTGASRAAHYRPPRRGPFSYAPDLQLRNAPFPRPTVRRRFGHAAVLAFGWRCSECPPAPICRRRPKRKDVRKESRRKRRVGPSRLLPAFTIQSIFASYPPLNYHSRCALSRLPPAHPPPSPSPSPLPYTLHLSTPPAFFGLTSWFLTSENSGGTPFPADGFEQMIIAPPQAVSRWFKQPP